MKTCPACGKSYSGAERFCREDGTPLPPESVVAELDSPIAAPLDSPAPAAPQVTPTPADELPESDDDLSHVPTVVGPVPRPTDDTTAMDERTPPPLPLTVSAAATAPTVKNPNSAAGEAIPALSMPARAPSAKFPAQKLPPPKKPAADVPSDTPTLLTSMTDDDGEPQSAYLGKLIDDRYLIQVLIGRGGMGAVYRCEQVHLRKIMAIKLLHENLISKKQLIARFTREARAISRLSSPHTVMVYDFGRYAELFYLVMELIEGEALDTLLDREGPLPADRAVRILLQMCDSLAEAHRHGIVHRDLKPENVMMVENAAHPDFVKILDFGLAKVEGVDDPYTIHSQRDIFGTPFYMSPEQIRAADIDGRADIYSVGALAFRMLTGKNVFQHKNTFDILKAHLMEAPPKMRDVAPGTNIPEVLEQVVAKALQKDPQLRFNDMDQMAQALVAALTSQFRETTVPATPEQRPSAVLPALETLPQGKPQPAPAQLRPSDVFEAERLLAAAPTRQKAHIWLFFAALLLIAAAIGVAAWLSHAPNPREQEPNDDVAHANPLGPGDQVQGVIGKRRSGQSGDQDCFLLPQALASEELILSAEGVPNMDLQFTLHRDSDKPLFAYSHRGKGQGERLRLLNPRLEPRVLCISEVQAPGQVPGESMSDLYTFAVQRQARPLHAETEPNDDPPGNESQPEMAWSGILDGPQDRDTFALSGSPENQLLQVEVELPPGQEQSWLRLALLDGSRRTLAARRLQPGEVKTTLASVGEARQLPDSIVISRHAPKGGELRPDEVPYTLRYRIIGAAEQAETEPNNTEESAQPMVLGAWHNGDTGDSAATDWLRVEGGESGMQQLSIEAAAPAGQYTLLIRDLGTKADLRQIPVSETAARTILVNNGSGEGFLLRVVPTDPPGKKKELIRWRLRARVMPNG